jgi:hypothetical protein
VVTVTLKDAVGNPLTTGGQVVSIYQLADGALEPGTPLVVTDNGDGTYSATASAAGTTVGDAFEFTAFLGTIPAGDFEIKGGPGAELEIVESVQAAQVLRTNYGLTRAALAADADKDGKSNLEEYAFGSNPADPTSATASVELVNTPNGVLIEAIVRDDPSMKILPAVTTDLNAGWDHRRAVEVHGAVYNEPVPHGFRRRTWQVPGTQANALFFRFIMQPN